MMDTDTQAEASKPRHNRERGQGAAFTVADLAERWRVGPDKIRAMIQRGELRAIDLATVGSRRPRWRVSPEAVATFEAARASGANKPQQSTPRARRRPTRPTGKVWF